MLAESAPTPIQTPDQGGANPDIKRVYDTETNQVFEVDNEGRTTLMETQSEPAGSSDNLDYDSPMGGHFATVEQQITSNGAHRVYGVDAEGKKHSLSHDTVLDFYGHSKDYQGKAPAAEASKSDNRERWLVRAANRVGKIAERVSGSMGNRRTGRETLSDTVATGRKQATKVGHAVAETVIKNPIDVSKSLADSSKEKLSGNKDELKQLLNQRSQAAKKRSAARSDKHEFRREKRREYRQAKRNLRKRKAETPYKDAANAAKKESRHERVERNLAIAKSVGKLALRLDLAAGFIAADYGVRAVKAGHDRIQTGMNTISEKGYSYLINRDERREDRAKAKAESAKQRRADRIAKRRSQTSPSRPTVRPKSRATTA